MKSADDTLLTGSHSVHGLDPGASHSATVTVTIPAATPPNAYFLLACADDQNAVAESNEANNCIATPGAIVTVARPDLVETTATTNPPAPVRAPGTTFSVTDTVRNARAGAVRALDDALLPLARRGEERRRHAPDRQPGGAGSGGRGQPFGDRHA